MKKFNFRLQKVLELKQHIEKRKQQELASLIKKLDGEKIVMKKLMDERESNQHQRKQFEGKGTKLLEISLVDKYLQFVRQRINHQKQVINQLETAISKKQSELLAAMKEKKTLENYKQKKRNEYQKAVQIMEQNFLDELAIRKYHPTINN